MTTRLLPAALLTLAAASPAAAALPVPEGSRAVELLPPPTQVFSAGHDYAVTTLARTSHRGWTDTSGYATHGQSARVTWHIDSDGEAILQGRDAWDPRAPWRELGRWGKGSKEKKRGETTVPLTGPTLLWLRVRAAAFPRKGISSLRLDYQRRTVAVLRGEPGAVRRPLILAEGYDPFNTVDWNDPAWQQDPALAGMVALARQRYSLDVCLLDWGDGGAPLEQQAEDFAEIARQLRDWNGGRRETVAVGVSMGAVALRYSLAAAAGTPGGLGVRKYISINGPHQGAWVNPKLLALLMRRARRGNPATDPETSEAFLVRRGLGSPAAQQLLTAGERHKAFYAALRALGKDGYDPAVERVAFSNGTLTREGQELAELVQGKRDVIHRVLVRPLGLPLWLTARKTRREFRYGAFPGELLPASLRQPVQGHVRFLSILRFDYRARWEGTPTFIPTHSALDFPESLVGGPERFRYARWRESPFERVYVAPGRNLAHDRQDVDWIDPRTGKGAPGGQSAVLHEAVLPWLAAGR